MAQKDAFKNNLALTGESGYHQPMKFSTVFTKMLGTDHGARTDLAKSLNVSLSYIIDVAAGRKKAPSIERCHQIIDALKLNKTDADILIEAAIEERIDKPALDEIKARSLYHDIRDKERANYGGFGGTASCPHCKNDIDVSVDHRGDISISAKVVGKVNKYK